MPWAGIVNLTHEEKELAACQDESTFVSWLIDDLLNANRPFPRSKSRFQHCPVTARAVQMSPHPEV